MERCELCSSFGDDIKQDSVLRRCISEKCKRTYFYATNKEMVLYYLCFLRNFEDKKGIMSKKFSKKKHRTAVYNKAWEIYIEEIISTGTVEEIVEIANHYETGTGVKKSIFMSSMLNQMAGYSSNFREPTNPCPVCICTEDDGYGSVMCSICTTMVCGYCFNRMIQKVCPLCRTSLIGSLDRKIELYQKIVDDKIERKSDIARVFLAILLLKKGEEKYREAYQLILDSIHNKCNKGLSIFSRLYLTGKGCRQNKKTSIGILEKGVREGDISCMIELGKYYDEGKHVPRNRIQMIEYFKMAALKKNINTILFFHRRYCV